MAQTFDLILRNGTVVTPNGTERTHIAVSDGRIRALGDLTGASAAEEMDLRGLTVLPGVIDTQVHFREPGLEHKEDLATGTAGAAQGGVVAIFEMPNTKPSSVSSHKLACTSSGRSWPDSALRSHSRWKVSRPVLFGG